MGLTGDFRTLDSWAKKFGELGSGRLAFECSTEMADAQLRAIAAEFSREQDPYNTRWRRTKVATGRKILHGKTGELRKFRKVSVNQHGYSIGTAALYLKFHQYGTKRMKPRKVLPSSRLPAALASTFRSIYVSKLRRSLR